MDGWVAVQTTQPIRLALPINVWKAGGWNRAPKTKTRMNPPVSQVVLPRQSHLSSMLSGWPNQSGETKKESLKLCCLSLEAHSKATPMLSYSWKTVGQTISPKPVVELDTLHYTYMEIQRVKLDQLQIKIQIFAAMLEEDLTFICLFFLNCPIINSSHSKTCKFKALLWCWPICPIF